MSRANTDDEEEITLPGSDASSLRELAPDAPGVPRLIHHRAPQDATAWAAAEIASATSNGIRPESLISDLFCPSGRKTDGSGDPSYGP